VRLVPQLTNLGYKEFATLPLPCIDPSHNPDVTAMLDRTKLSTHQYARSQLKWIKKQLLPAVREARGHGGEVGVYVVHGGPAGEGVAREVMQRKSTL
jgi:tRNA dimethylallyltransferase